jgi:hypothetical protein
MSMVKVICQDCGRTSELNDYYVPEMIESGEVVEATKRVRVVDSIRKDVDGVMRKFEGESDSYVTGLFDLCKKCRLKPGLPPGHPEQVREDRIQHKIRLLHEARPDLDFEARVHAAVEEEFDPKYEPNEAFRKYLMERRGL